MILILGGTSDSIIIANNINKTYKNVVFSTATKYGKELASKKYSGKIIYGKKDKNELYNFCRSEKINIIIDATHPYANLVSKNAIKVSKELNICYIRYERPVVVKEDERYIYCDSYKEAGQIINNLEGNALLTTGSKDIENILNEINNKDRAYIRVLPMSNVIAKLEELHILPDQIIAMKGPFSKEFNKALMERIQCKILVTKESGSQGKTIEKIEAANECNAKVIVIRRPIIEYPKVMDNIEELMEEL
ncbi:MAG: precorrin-6A reductase [Vallitalea sp.]|jgi:precorrin-6A/cobalt-precorrin-6A reductase|nr:precorrin-6A reductase [Vallitalea sp.]